MNRRMFIVAFGTLASASALHLIPFKSFAGSPRFRHRKGKLLSFPQQNGMIYINRNSGSIHFRRLRHVLPISSSLTLANYERISFREVVEGIESQANSVATNRVEIFTSRPQIIDLRIPRAVLEAIALEFIKAGQYQEATLFLFEKLLITKPGMLAAGMRLVDLLAALTARFGSDDDFARFMALVRKENTLESSEWQERMRKWQDTNSSWHKKWKNRSENVTWAGLLM